MLPMAFYVYLYGQQFLGSLPRLLYPVGMFPLYCVLLQRNRCGLCGVLYTNSSFSPDLDSYRALGFFLQCPFCS
jgi:hypothetical protein